MKSKRTPTTRTGRASLPSMTQLLDAARADERLAGVSHAELFPALQQVVAAARSRADDGRPADDVHTLVDRAAEAVARARRQRVQRVINATGIVLHTGLGRAPLAPAAIDAIVGAARGYCNVELDLESGDRGRRGDGAEHLLRCLTKCEAALVVNNNAGATMLVLAALASGREVVVSRGQLVEIGGSYRLPDVMAAGGAVLREVGTTNKTRLADYERAIGERTSLMMRVHTSNFRIVGFAESPTTAELAGLARKYGLALYDDLGSGAMLDDEMWRVAGEPIVGDSLRDGADVVSFSGDKLLGGPQAGIILGRREVLDRIRAHPMARGLRVDKLTLAALEATLALYLCDSVAEQLPALAMLRAPMDELRQRAVRLMREFVTRRTPGRFAVREDTSYAGGGSLPAHAVPTIVVEWQTETCSADDAAARLRRSSPPVIARIRDGRVLFDMRTIAAEDERPLIEAIVAVDKA
ncbi:MAG: L-seryl-tRNA(Sec) selenium transferase [Phycisphaerae bacterium]|nr:L-seryl-tRNA(Sec) selenium transferase [Phycisphaerae bacterium]